MAGPSALRRGARPGILAGALVAFLGFEGCLGERSAGGWAFGSVWTSAGLVLGAYVGLRGGGAAGAQRQGPAPSAGASRFQESCTLAWPLVLPVPLRP